MAGIHVGVGDGFDLPVTQLDARQVEAGGGNAGNGLRVEGRGADELHGAIVVEAGTQAVTSKAR